MSAYVDTSDETPAVVDTTDICFCDTSTIIIIIIIIIII